MLLRDKHTPARENRDSTAWGVQGRPPPSARDDALEMRMASRPGSEGRETAIQFEKAVRRDARRVLQVGTLLPPGRTQAVQLRCMVQA